MSFTTNIFLFFYFPFSILGYAFLRLCCVRHSDIANKAGSVFLIICSLFFYGWKRPETVIVFLLYMLLIYMLGQWISRGSERNRKTAAAVGIVIVTVVLFYYKYYNFVLEEILGGENRILLMYDIIAPLGISFITFSAISYLVDLYRGDASVGNILDVMLYLCFFPKIISGPIVLWKDFAPQINNRKVDDKLFLDGLNRMMIGFAKKVILADTFGALVEQMQHQAFGGRGITSLTAWGCTVLYMLQIYYDFAGYSDVAIGISELFGFRFKENFHYPYISKSITEFWRRWHISLGIWFREYIYIPLGGNRKGQARTLVNLGIVFLITGIWHGAGWNYIWWGVLNGVCVVVERCLRDTKAYKKIPNAIKWAVTMTVVLFSWELFCFQNMEEFEVFIKIMFGKIVCKDVTYSAAYFFKSKIIVYMVIACVGAVIPASAKFEKIKGTLNSTKTGVAIQETAFLAVMIAAVISMVNSTYSPFIYFQY